MKVFVLLAGAAVFVCVGVVVGVFVAESADEGVEPAPASSVEVLVRDADGRVVVYDAEAAAARIESLESALRGRRHVSAAPDPDGEPPEQAEPPAAPAAAALLGPDGRPYTPQELVAFALDGSDPARRAAALKALRGVGGDEVRTSLEKLYADTSLPQDVRLLAAEALVRPPHRDRMPEELIAALTNEQDPEIRRVLAEGVAALRDRGAWMREIATLLSSEADAEVRRSLLGAVARTARDPAALAQLVDIAVNAGGSADERRIALEALSRTRPDRDALERIAALQDDRDPAVRAQALRILAADRAMPLAALESGLADVDAGVRAIALSRALSHLDTFRRAKDADRGALDAAAQRAADLAAHDADAAVRRAGMDAARSLPRDLRDSVLEAGRADSDLGVRLVAYARSPRDVAEGAVNEFLGALSSNERWQRDYAYGQLRRLFGVRVPFDGGWNPAARNAAIAEIRTAVGTSGR